MSQSKSRLPKRKVISLFSSAGIGDLGVRNNGLEIVVSNELIRERHRLYEANYQKTKCFTGDVWALKKEIVKYYRKCYKEAPPFLIIATPPCQGMSTNGAGRLKHEILQGRRSDEDIRNRLIVPTMDIISELKPEWVLLENVPGMRNTIIKDENNNCIGILDYINLRLGSEYIGGAEVLACEDYGIPQVRKRLITLYTRTSKGKEYYKKYNSFFTNIKKSRKLTLRDAILNLPKLDAVAGKNEKKSFHPLHLVPIMNPEKYWWVSCTKEGDQAYNNQCAKCGFSANAKHTDQNIDGKWVSNKDTPIYCQSCKELLPRPTMIDKKTGRRRLIRGFHSAYRRMVWDKPANTLTQNFQFEASDNKIHPDQNRVLSIYEALRIQTISDYKYEFVLNGKTISRSMFAEIIGESAPPKLIDIICSEILKITNKPGQKKVKM